MRIEQLDPVEEQIGLQAEDHNALAHAEPALDFRLCETVRLDLFMDAAIVLLHALLLVVADNIGVHLHALDAERIIRRIALIAGLAEMRATAIFLIGEPEEESGGRGQHRDPEPEADIGAEKKEAQQSRGEQRANLTRKAFTGLGKFAETVGDLTTTRTAAAGLMPSLIEAQQLGKDIDAELTEERITDLSCKSPTHELVERVEHEFIAEQDGEGDQDRLCGIVFVRADEEDKSIAASDHQSLSKQGEDDINGKAPTKRRQQPPKFSKHTCPSGRAGYLKDEVLPEYPEST